MEISIPAVQMIFKCSQVGIDEGEYDWDRNRCGRRRVRSISELNGNRPLVSLTNLGENVGKYLVGSGLP